MKKSSRKRIFRFLIKYLIGTMVRKIIILIGVVLLLVNVTIAYDYDIEYINLNVGESGFVRIEEKLIIKSDVNETSIVIPKFTGSLSISNYTEELKYVVEALDSKEVVTIYMATPSKGKERAIFLRYGTQHLTTKTGGVWNITFSFPVTSLPETPVQTLTRINFPQNTRILSWGPTSWYTPEKDAIWLYTYPNEREKNFTAIYEYEISMTTTIRSNASGNISVPPTISSNRILLIIFLSLIVLIYFIFIFARKRPEVEEKKEVMEPRVDIPIDVVEIEKEEPEIDVTEKTQTISVSETIEKKPELKEEQKIKKVKQSIMNVLDENEKTIVQLLEGYKEEITQAYIYKTTNIPKASLSDILKRLESRNILERTREGRVNWIKLKEWVFEDLE